MGAERHPSIIIVQEVVHPVAHAVEDVVVDVVSFLVADLRQDPDLDRDVIFECLPVLLRPPHPHHPHRQMRAHDADLGPLPDLSPGPVLLLDKIPERLQVHPPLLVRQLTAERIAERSEVLGRELVHQPVPHKVDALEQVHDLVHRCVHGHHHDVAHVLAIVSQRVLVMYESTVRI